MTTIDVTYSAEMMTNYLQAELISPQKKFEALQTSQGFSLLFSIGTDGAFNVIRDQNATSAAGWSVTDLGKARIKKDFPSGGAVVNTFEAGQSVADGSLGLAMVVEVGSASHLYLSLANSDQDLSWIDAPAWTSYPYDNPSVDLSSLEIVDVYFCEPVGSTQYIVVDVLRDPTSAVKDIHRFFIDPTKKSGHFWNSHDLPIDIEAGSYDSVLGRAPKGYVDGLYTAGRAGSSGQLAFVPIINVFGTAPPSPMRLNLPGGAIPDAIASTRNADLSTDLFVTSGSTLYYFASTNQADGAVGSALVTDAVLSDTEHLAAMSHGGVTTLWGRNGSDQVFSISCPTASVATGAAWSVPVPLLSGVEEMSPYVNKADGGNTIFASGDGKLERITRNSATSLWDTDQITLPAPPTQPSISFDSYTTTIQVADENGLPTRDATLSISASQRSAVFVNGLYYVIGVAPIHVQPTSLGTITIVEATTSLTGTSFDVSAGGGTTITIHPMEEPFKKLAALDTPEALKGATVPGSGKRLVSANASSDDVQAVATGMKNLSKSYDQLTTNAPAGVASPAVAAAPVAFAAPQPVTAASIGDDILIAAGDLFKWLESGVEAVIEIVEDAATAVWHFVATIAGEVYRAALDTVHAVVGAVEWVFKAVETAIDDLIKFVEFLFEWDDIRRTKEVFHNLLKRFLEGQVAEISELKAELDNAFTEAEKTIAQWAGISDWSPLGEPASKPAATSSSDPMKGQTSGSQHLSHHFQNNASNISITGDAPEPSLIQSLIDDLFTALQNEAHVLDNVIDELRQLASDFSSLSVEDVIKRLVGILAEGVLGSAQVVIDVILDILADVAAATLKLLDTKIHIPVISDILSAIGIPEFSFLDLFCWVPAVAYTVVYKIAKDSAPFPDDENTTFLSNATSWQQLQQAFDPSSAPTQPAPTTSSVPPILASHLNVASMTETDSTSAALVVAQPAAAPQPVFFDLITLPESVAEAVFVAGHSFAGFFTLMSDFVTTFEAAEESGDNVWSIPSAVLGVLAGGAGGGANFLVPKDPIENEVVAWVSRGTLGIRILNKIMFSGVLQKKFAAATGVMKNLAADDGRATGSIIDAILVIPALVTTGWHFYELSQDDAGSERTAAILDEVSNLTSYVSRVAYAIAVNDDDEESRLILIGVMAVANVATAGLQTAEAIAGA